MDGRIWFVTSGSLDMSGLSVEQVVSGGFSLHDAYLDVYLIEDTESLINLYATDVSKNKEVVLTRKSSTRSTFDVHPSENVLNYVKEPCSAEDVQDTFFLHVDPVDVDDLPDHRKQYGFDNLDFRFDDRGFRSSERCLARRELPDYAITRIRTGQFLVNEDGSTTQLWGAEIRVNE